MQTFVHKCSYPWSIVVSHFLCDNYEDSNPTIVNQLHVSLSTWYWLLHLYRSCQRSPYYYYRLLSYCITHTCRIGITKWPYRILVKNFKDKFCKSRWITKWKKLLVYLFKLLEKINHNQFMLICYKLSFTISQEQVVVHKLCSLFFNWALD